MLVREEVDWTGSLSVFVLECLDDLCWCLEVGVGIGGDCVKMNYSSLLRKSDFVFVV